MINKKSVASTFFIAAVSLLSFSPLSAQISGDSGTLQDTLSNHESAIINIGYGERKITDLYSSVTNFTTDEFNKGFITSPLELIIGKIPGLTISNSNPYPGSDYSIGTLRNSSIYYSISPLIVVDDIALTGSPLNMNPNDIESITFLREGPESCIYGSRASNGVLMVRTKKGTDKLRFNYTGQLALSVVQKRYDVFDADEFRTIVNNVYSEEPDVTSLLGTASTDWQDEIYRTAFSNSHYLSMTGSPFKIPLRISIGKTFQNGVVKTSGLDRTTLSLAISPKFLKDHLKISLNANGVIDNNRLTDIYVVRDAFFFDPTQPVYSGNSINGGYTDLGLLATPNPVAVLNLSDNRRDMNRWIGNIKMDYKLHFLPDMNIILNAGIDYSSNNNHSITDTAATWIFYNDGEGLVSDYNYSVKNKMLDLYLAYSKEIKSISSDLHFTGGISYNNSRIDEYTYLSSLVNPETYYDKFTLWLENSVTSVFGRLFFTIKDKYSLQLSLNDFGDSHYSPQNRWSLYPAISLTWNLKNESFMNNIGAFQDLKVHVGYGVKNAFETRNFAVYPDMEIRQEVLTFCNLGIDYAILNGRLTGNIGVYYNIGYNLIEKLPVPSGTTLSNYIFANVGEAENKGLELSINALLISSRSLAWRFNYYLAAQSIKMLDLKGGGIGIETGSIPGGVGNTIQIFSEGYPVKSFYAMQQVYDENGRPVEGLFVDNSDDGSITSEDRHHYKKSTPDVLMGISSDFTFRNWELAFSGRVSVGNYVYNAENSLSYYDRLYTHSLRNISSSVLSSGFYNYQGLSDYYIENASFFKLDYISLGYNIGSLFGNKVACRMTALLQNAFTITGYTGPDPEVASGISDFNYPRARTGSLQVSIDF